MTNSTRRNAVRKLPRTFSARKHAAGVSADFPLHIHKSGRWAKKVRGKRHYFGTVASDPTGQAALKLWLDQKDELLAGRTPRAKLDGLTVGELCNKFLAAKRVQVNLKKLSPRSFVEYTGTTDLLVETFGKNRLVDDLRPTDFETHYHKLTRKHTITTLGREVTHARSVFKYGVESDLIERAIKFGPMFKGPTKSDKRKARAKTKHAHGARMFSSDEIAAMLKAATAPLKAMILLGINGGLGNTDCAKLPLSALDLDAGWLDYPRPKTGIERRIPLWPETVEALRAVIAKRPKAKAPDDAGLVFITKRGQPWVRYELSEGKSDAGKVEVTGKADDAIAKATRKLVEALGFYRRGVTFYALRHTFETIAGASRDQVAVDAIMGHVDATMAGEYREHIGDDRLVAVVQYVHSWLFAKPKPNAKQKRQTAPLRVVG